MMDIDNEAKAKVIAGVVKNQQMILALRRPKAPANRLDESHLRFCRLRVDETADHRKIDADRERRDVANHPHVDGAKAIEDLLTLIPGRVAIDVSRRNSSLDKPLLKVLGMSPIYAVAKRLPVFASPHPCLDDVANERGFVDGFRELPLVKFARDRADSRQVGL